MRLLRLAHAGIVLTVMAAGVVGLSRQASSAAPSQTSIEAALPAALKAGASPLDHPLKNNDEQYARARAELPEDYYTLYRIVERISRANSLNSRPWRVVISPEYDINAFATDVNLLAFYNGLLDQIDGDPNALACVVGHEMAHHTEEHIALAEADREMRLQTLREEALAEVTAEEEDLEDDLRQMGVGEWVSGNAGRITSIAGRQAGGIGGLVGGIIGGQIRRDRQRRLEAAVERVNTIYEAKEAQFLAEETERNHSHEFEADQVGYQYMVRAGFDPQGCNTMLGALNRIPGSQRDSATHPAIPSRIGAVDAMEIQYPVATLQAEGNANLAAHPTALTYDLSRDGGSLRVNSQMGSRDIDDLLPQ